MFEFIDHIKKIVRNTDNILRYSYDDRKYMERQFGAITKTLKQIGEKVSKTDEAVDQLISVVTPLIQAGQELSAALTAANERAIALAAELAEFKATDAEEDARQLASQDEELAARTRDKTAKLAADIAAIQNPPVAEQPPTEQPPAEPEPEPAAEEPAAEPAPAETEEPAAAEQVDEGTATEDAAVIVVDEGASEGELGAGDPAVITPEVNTQPEDVELPAARRRR